MKIGVLLLDSMAPSVYNPSNSSARNGYINVYHDYYVGDLVYIIDNNTIGLLHAPEIVIHWYSKKQAWAKPAWCKAVDLIGEIENTKILELLR